MCLFISLIEFTFTYEVKRVWCHRGEHKPEKLGHLSTGGGNGFAVDDSERCIVRSIWIL